MCWERILKKNVFIFDANALVKAIISADANGDERSPDGWRENVIKSRSFHTALPYQDAEDVIA